MFEHARLPCDRAFASMEARADDITMAVDTWARHDRPKKLTGLGGVRVVAFPQISVNALEMNLELSGVSQPLVTNTAI